MTRPSGSSAPSVATFASLCFCVFVFLWLLRCITVFTKQSTAVFRRDCTFDPHQVTFPAVVCTFCLEIKTVRALFWRDGAPFVNLQTHLFRSQRYGYYSARVASPSRRAGRTSRLLRKARPDRNAIHAR